GGQGEVYLASSEGRDVALKWYFRHMGTPEQKEILKKLIELGPPDKRFLWPEDLIEKPANKGGYGYVMPLREDRFQGVISLLAGNVSPSYRVLTTAAFELVDAFFNLHAKGLSYRDINEGGVFIDFSKGDVLICDNDNVYVDGLGDATVLGKMRWMAPEIVRGMAKPSRDTDLYSLSVLLFFLFVVNHPLDGKLEANIKCKDLRAMTRLYGEKPVFIYDPGDESNRPDPDYHRNALALWPNYPYAFQRLFVRAFTDGLHDPEHGRVQENEWRKALVELRDLLFKCNYCDSEVFYDLEKVRGGIEPACLDCGKVLSSPARMKIEGYDGIIVLEEGTMLYDHHLRSRCEFQLEKPRALVVANPKDARRKGLKNLTDNTWVVTNESGKRSEVETGRSAGFSGGETINFGERRASVRV
ncbi:MAG: hypothetical protein RJP95_03810, partial [Pirellulales bacterium]